MQAFVFILHQEEEDMQKKVLLYPLALGLALSPIFANGSSEAKQEGPRTVKISVWTREGDTNHWRADLAKEAAVDLNKQLAAEGKDITIDPEPYIDGGDWGGFKKKYALAADSGEAPMIVISGHEDIATWGPAGYIVPFGDSVNAVEKLAPQFSDIKDNLWHCVTWNNKIWGIPQDCEARPMFFNKTLLKQMGWTDAQVAALPQELADGSFTQEDLIATAEEAVKKGVVKQGYGYWHRPLKGGDFIQFYVTNGGHIYDAEENKLIIERDPLIKCYEFQKKCVDTGITPKSYIGTEWNIWHNAVANNQVLFFNGGTWMWADWAKNYAKGGEDALFKNIGYGYEPTGIKGVPGTTLSHPLAYLVSSPSACGSKDQDLAFRLIGLMETTERNTRHAVESGHLGVLKSQDTYKTYEDSKFLSSCAPLLQNNFFQPNHPMYGIWFDSFWTNLVSAEQGEKTPQQAADDCIKTMKADIGDQLIVR